MISPPVSIVSLFDTYILRRNTLKVFFYMPSKNIGFLSKILPVSSMTKEREWGWSRAFLLWTKVVVEVPGRKMTKTFWPTHSVLYSILLYL